MTIVFMIPFGTNRTGLSPILLVVKLQLLSADNVAVGSCNRSLSEAATAHRARHKVNKDDTDSKPRDSSQQASRPPTYRPDRCLST